jgi:hypothetical protein
MFIYLVLQRKISQRPLAKAVGWDFPADGVEEDRRYICWWKVVGTNTYHPRVTNLTRVMIDEPVQQC